MTYKQIKWLILVGPAVMIGLWEYIRHEFLLSIISMNTGNVLTPILLLVISLVINRQLFKLMEKQREELEEEKMKKAIMEERQAISSELHDSISQSLFLLGVKIDRLERETNDDNRKQITHLKQAMQNIQKNVRQSIKQLRKPNPIIHSWHTTLKELVERVQAELPDATIDINWELNDEEWSMEEKVQTYFIIREALTNIIKHATDVTHIVIEASPDESGWRYTVSDDGDDPYEYSPEDTHYGLDIMNERAQQMGWHLQIKRSDDRTIVKVEVKH
ncbi:sensor histidine kinase [Thalassobacillus hwangdonensis]|uniref:histidine kinase n=1 Tax=Thalassobacillus hwangdonensis TaxID=546108 RepID=A0ABW3L7L8_9BACI